MNSLLIGNHLLSKIPHLVKDTGYDETFSPVEFQNQLNETYNISSSLDC